MERVSNSILSRLDEEPTSTIPLLPARIKAAIRWGLSMVSTSWKKSLNTGNAQYGAYNMKGLVSSNVKLYVLCESVISRGVDIG